MINLSRTNIILCLENGREISIPKDGGLVTSTRWSRRIFLMGDIPIAEEFGYTGILYGLPKPDTNGRYLPIIVEPEVIDDASCSYPGLVLTADLSDDSFISLTRDALKVRRLLKASLGR